MKIEMEGFQDITATLLGFDKILISTCKEGGVLKVVETDKELWNKVFSEINTWSRLLKSRGRQIWFRILGVPSHA
jgi:hypothetical protein